jgi:hypothetical protein
MITETCEHCQIEGECSADDNLRDAAVAAGRDRWSVTDAEIIAEGRRYVTDGLARCADHA